MRLKGLAVTAGKLGIRYRTLELENGGHKTWRATQSSQWKSVEAATLEFYEAEGWSGYAREQGLILSLIKAASFPELPPIHFSTFIEAVYFTPVWPFGGVKHERAWLLANILNADAGRIAANFHAMTTPPALTLQFFPTLTLDKMLGLYSALGNARLQAIATLFSVDPYTQRSGWPDLTLWRSQEVVFKEVKAPGDELRVNQERLIKTLLQPLDYDVELVEVFPINNESGLCE